MDVTYDVLDIVQKEVAASSVQYVGDRLALTVTTEVTIPDYVASQGEEAIGQYLKGVLGPREGRGVTFNVLTGPSTF